MSSNHTQKASFFCPVHGLLEKQIVYASFVLEGTELHDIACMYCEGCDCYYSPFGNLLHFVPSASVNGKPLRESEIRIGKSTIKRSIKSPYWGKLRPTNTTLPTPQKQASEAKRKKQVKNTAPKVAPPQKELVEVETNEIILTNKSLFVNERKCPDCQTRVAKKYVSILHSTVYLQRCYKFRGSLFYCPSCSHFYLSKSQLEKLNDKALDIMPKGTPYPFVKPGNVKIDEAQAEGNRNIHNFKYIPLEMLNFEKYDRWNPPPKCNKYYDPTNEEYEWILGYYEPESPFVGNLKSKSFLGEAGYSTTEPEKYRKRILDQCVSKYGKAKVIKQIKFNITQRSNQQNGEIKYAHAISIWLSDISYIEVKYK